jgi:hypothetical protein
VQKFNSIEEVESLILLVGLHRLLLILTLAPLLELLLGLEILLGRLIHRASMRKRPSLEHSAIRILKGRLELVLLGHLLLLIVAEIEALVNRLDIGCWLGVVVAELIQGFLGIV